MAFMSLGMLSDELGERNMWNNKQLYLIFGVFMDEIHWQKPPNGHKT
jgi:hypothetical protein